MDSEIGALLCALAALCIPLLLAWGIVAWQGRRKPPGERM